MINHQKKEITNLYTRLRRVCVCVNTIHTHTHTYFSLPPNKWNLYTCVCPHTCKQTYRKRCIWKKDVRLKKLLTLEGEKRGWDKNRS